MAKEIPFFKFFPSEWIMGNISYENYSTQGLFITACCHYWHQECNISEASLSKILGKRNVKKLKELDYLDVKNEQICIDFLDEQFTELSDLHKVRVSNGRKGGLSKAKAQLKSGSSIKDKEEDKEEDKEGKSLSSFGDWKKIISSDEVFIKNLFQELRGKWTYLSLGDLHNDLNQKLTNYQFYQNKFKFKLNDEKHLKNSFKKFAKVYWNHNSTQIEKIK